MKTMEKPKLEEIEPDPADVITTSGPMTNGGDDKEGDYGEVTGFGDL